MPPSKEAVEVLTDMKELFGDEPYAFPSIMSGKKILSENSINSALRRMGVTGAKHTAHGFRFSASSIINKSGEFSADAIEARLAHLDPRAVRRIYNRAAYWNERVRMMQWWGDMLDVERAAKISA